MYTLGFVIGSGVFGMAVGMVALLVVIALMNRNDPKIYTQQEWDANNEDWNETLNQYVKEYGRRKSET